MVIDEKFLYALAAVGGYALVNLVLLGLLSLISRRRFPTRPGGVVLITGTSTGIGADACVALAKAGYQVFAGVRKEADAEIIRGHKLANLHPIILEVTDLESVNAAHKTIESFMQTHNLPFAGLVNNAGMLLGGVTEFQPLDDVRKVMEVNVYGVLNVTRRFLPLIRHYEGRVVNLSSVMAFMSSPRYMAYGMSKRALEGMSETLRQELVNLNVAVSMVSPGVVGTALHQRELPHDDEGRKAYSHLYKPNTAKYTPAGPSGTASTCSAIVHAMSSAYPKTKYYTAWAEGLPCFMVRFLKWILPDRFHDFIIMNFTQ